MSNTRRQIRQEMGRKSGLMVLDSTCTSAGATTTIVDTALTDGRLATDEYENLYAFRPAAAGAGDKVRRVASFATATLTHSGVAYSVVPATSEVYELWSGIDPREVDRFLSRVLRRSRYTRFVGLGLLTDGDMENSGVGDWTRSSLDNTLSIKTTAAANVRWGSQSLRVKTSGTSGFARPGAVNVVPNNGYYVRGLVQTATGTARLQAYDATNSAAIDAATSTDTPWMDLGFAFTVPSTCKSLQVRLVGDASGDDAYWDQVQCFRQGQQLFDVPLAVDPNDLARMWRCRYRGSQMPGSGGAYDDTYEWQEVGYALAGEEVAANRIRIRLHEPVSGPWFPVAELHLLYADLTDDNTTGSTIDLDWAVAGLEFMVYDQLASPSRTANPAERQEWRHKAKVAAKEWYAYAHAKAPSGSVDTKISWF